ncbi:MAG: hypothetical protein PHY47_00760 [Lachnospiraceae bacterium]|nr:hypothetical protein [Lachnospiraceae bacterium]
MKHQLYVVTKLGRKQSPEYTGPSQVWNGIHMCGQEAAAFVPTDETINWAIKYQALESQEEKDKLYKETEPTGLFDWNRQWEEQDTLVPKIGWPVYFRPNRMDAGWLRTSNIRSYYIHESEDGTDKLVLPKEIQEEAMHLEFPEMSKGDVLLCTANSIYYAKLSAV